MYEVGKHKSLLRLAVVSNNIIEEQAKFLEKEFCRENI